MEAAEAEKADVETKAGHVANNMNRIAFIWTVPLYERISLLYHGRC